MNLICLIGATLISVTCAKLGDDSASQALNQFALKFLAETSHYVSNNVNLALSPYTIWTAMSIVNEGARGHTAEEMEMVLGIPPNGTLRDDFRKLQRHIIENIGRKQEGVTLEVLNSLFTRLEAVLRPEYVKLVRDIYNVQVQPLDFNNATGAANYINNVLSEATKGRITNIVNEDLVQQAQMFIMSALFFKGTWDKKFDKDDTKEMPFYNEQREIIGKVEMMRNSGGFPYGAILNKKAVAVELPYVGDRLSMIVILPIRDSLASILRAIAETPLSKVVDYLTKSKEMFNSEVKVLLPKFKITTDLDLCDMLKNVGIRDVFAQEADLSGISSGSLYVSRVKHRAEIEVDEEGTTGSASTTIDVQDKTMPSVFQANKPFAFFIIDKETSSLIFMGTVYNPKPTPNKS